MNEANDNGARKKKKYCRSAVFIDKNFQTRYLLLIVGTACLIIVVLGLMYASVLSDQRDLMGINAMGVGGKVTAADVEFDAGIERMAKAEDENRLVVLFVSSLLLVGILSWVAVKMTFRVVGPVKAASAMLRGMTNGDSTSVRHFRKGDEFSFLAQDIIDLYNSVNVREREMLNVLEESAAEIRKAGGDIVLAERIDGLIGNRDIRPPEGAQED